MAGVEQGNVSNEKFMEDVARYQWVYHRNSKDFKDKNEKANCWEKVGEKFNLSAAEAEVKFRNIRTAYGRYLKRLKTLPSGSGRDIVPREVQNRLTKRRNKFVCSKISSSTSAILFAAISRQHNTRVILTVPLSEMFATVGSAIACDRLRLYGNQPLRSLFAIVCDLRFAIRDRLRSSAIIWKPAFNDYCTHRFCFRCLISLWSSFGVN